MKLLMMGTGPFAVPTFESLVTSRHEVLGLVTRPPAGSHRQKRKDINPMRQTAERLGVPVMDPPNVNDPDFAPTLRGFGADLMVVCDYGQILSREALESSRLGGINLHGSLLPRYRGAAPINWALFNGESVTGITVILMTPRLDGGPILDRLEVPIQEEDTAVSLEKRLAELGPDLVARSIERLENWDGASPIGQIQDQQQATRAPRLTKEYGHVDWTRSAEKIRNQIRAFQPWPGTYSSILRSQAHRQEPQRLIFLAAEVIPDHPGNLEPGQLVTDIPDELVVQTGQGQLRLTLVQPAGKKPMTAADYLRGHPLAPGDHFLA